MNSQFLTKECCRQTWTAVLLPYQCRTRYLPSPIRCSATDSTVVEFAGGGGLSDETMGRDAGPFFLAEGVRGLLLIPYHTTKSRDTIQKGTTPFHTIPHHTDYTIYIYIYCTIYHTTPQYHHIHATPKNTIPYHNIPCSTTRRHHTTPPNHGTTRYGTGRDEVRRCGIGQTDGTGPNKTRWCYIGMTGHFMRRGETRRGGTGWDNTTTVTT